MNDLREITKEPYFLEKAGFVQREEETRDVSQLDFPGDAYFTYPIDMNNDGQVLGFYGPSGFDGPPSEPVNIIGYFLWDDGHFFKVSLPTTMGGLPAFFDLNGMNDEGQFTGQYSTAECTPGVFECKFTRKGFVASPRREVVKRR